MACSGCEIAPVEHIGAVLARPKVTPKMESFRANLPSTDLNIPKFWTKSGCVTLMIFIGVAQRGTQIEKEKEESAWFPRSMANMDILSIRS